MMEAILCILALAADQLLKYWSVTVLAALPGGSKAIIEGVFYFHYAENYGENVSFIRSRNIVMTLIRLAQLALVVYLLVAHRKKLAHITRGALAFFLAGMLGNQLNYLFMDFVPDMLYIPALGSLVFNLADVWVMFAMVVLFIRLAFFEGRDLMDWLEKKFAGKKKGQEGQGESAPPQKEEPEQRTEPLHGEETVQQPPVLKDRPEKEE